MFLSHSDRRRTIGRLQHSISIGFQKLVRQLAQRLGIFHQQDGLPSARSFLPGMP